MNTRTILLVAICLLLLAGASFSQDKKQKPQQLREMSVGTFKPTLVITPSPDSSILVVRSSIPNLRLESNLSDRVKELPGGVWHMYLPSEPQVITFFVEGEYKRTARKHTFAKNRSYEVQVKPKKGSKTLWWVLGGAAAAGGAFVALSGGDGTPPPVEKLPDPPGSPTGN